MFTKCAARTAPASVLLGAPLKSPPPGTACRDALLQRQWRCTFGTRADQYVRRPATRRSKLATLAEVLNLVATGLGRAHKPNTDLGRRNSGNTGLA